MRIADTNKHSQILINIYIELLEKSFSSFMCRFIDHLTLFYGQKIQTQQWMFLLIYISGFENSSGRNKAYDN